MGFLLESLLLQQIPAHDLYTETSRGKFSQILRPARPAEGASGNFQAGAAGAILRSD